MYPLRQSLARWLVPLSVALTAAGALVVALVRPFRPPKQPRSVSHPLTVYDTAAIGAPVVSPFHLDTQPMQSLALFNFEGDEDVIYKGLEPQAFDDDVHGRGLLVIGWRVDGRVDVFHDPGIRPDPANFAIAGDGLHRIEERDLSGARFEIGPNGLSLDVSFLDLEGRTIRLFAHETDARPRRPFALLAPMGTAATNPPALPLVFVKDFYFVRRAGSEIRIEIDDRDHRSDTLPLLIDSTWMRFVRYSATPFIALWNHHDHSTVQTLASSTDTAVVDGTVAVDGTRYDIVANGPFREIRRMARHEGDQRVTLEFTPALPHLAALSEEVEVDGSFSISTDPPAGSVTGTWSTVRRGDRIEVEVVPCGGWTPGTVPPMARVLFRVITMFRSWPTTYRWSATVDVDLAGDTDRPPALRSSWSRIH